MPRLPMIDPAGVSNEWKHTVRTYSELGEKGPDQYQPPVSIDEESVEGDVQGDFPPFYAVLGHNPPMIHAFRSAVGYIREYSGLSDFQLELVILTLTKQFSHEYWWDRHVMVALAGPMDRADIEAIATDDLVHFEEEDQAIARYAAHFASRTVTDSHIRALAEQIDDETIVGLSMLSGTYTGAIFLMDALDIQPASEFIGWHLENLE